MCCFRCIPVRRCFREDLEQFHNPPAVQHHSHRRKQSIMTDCYEKQNAKLASLEASDRTSDASGCGTDNASGILLTVAYMALLFSFLSVLFGAGCIHLGCAAMLPWLRRRHVRYGCLARAGDCLSDTPGRRREETDTPQGPRTHLLPQSPLPPK